MTIVHALVAATRTKFAPVPIVLNLLFSENKLQKYL